MKNSVYLANELPYDKAFLDVEKGEMCITGIKNEKELEELMVKNKIDPISKEDKISEIRI
jgi:hypothetical protein